MNEPTTEMWRALLDFRERHGRYWKRALSLKWMNGNDEFEHLSASLRMVRNQLGPTWLYALRPAALEAAARRLATLDSQPGNCRAEPGLEANLARTITDAGPAKGRGSWGMCGGRRRRRSARAASIRRSP